MAKTYAQIQKEIETLRREAEKLREKEVADVVAGIKEAMSAYGLTLADLGLQRGRGRPVAAAGRQSTARKSASASAKYRDDQGNTWGGRGPRPLWLRAALEAGSSLQDFEV